MGTIPCRIPRSWLLGKREALRHHAAVNALHRRLNEGRPGPKSTIPKALWVCCSGTWILALGPLGPRVSISCLLLPLRLYYWLPCLVLDLRTRFIRWAPRHPNPCARKCTIHLNARHTHAVGEGPVRPSVPQPLPTVDMNILDLATYAFYHRQYVPSLFAHC